MRRLALAKKPNKALHRTALPLRSNAAGKLYRYIFCKDLNVRALIQTLYHCLCRKPSKTARSQTNPSALPSSLGTRVFSRRKSADRKE